MIMVQAVNGNYGKDVDAERNMEITGSELFYSESNIHCLEKSLMFVNDIQGKAKFYEHELTETDDSSC